jgi:hypothetical protein
VSEVLGARRVAGAVCCVCNRAAALCVDDEGREFCGVVQVAPHGLADKWICRSCGRRVAAGWVRAVVAGRQ